MRNNVVRAIDCLGVSFTKQLAFATLIPVAINYERFLFRN